MLNGCWADKLIDAALSWLKKEIDEKTSENLSGNDLPKKIFLKIWKF